MLHTFRRACAARVIPSRVLLRGHPARNASGTLLRGPAVYPALQSQAHGHSSYSTVAVEEAVPSKKKVWDSIDEAIKDVKSGDVVLSGGACGRSNECPWNWR